MPWTVDSLTYTKRKKITISKTNVSATLTDFPLYVRISGDSNIGGVAKSDGTDLRFTDANDNLLYCEKESFVITGGSATGDFWVKVSSISTSVDTDIYVYYGNSGASAQSNPENVWDDNFKCVYHMTDASSATILDSTGNSNDLTSNTASSTTSGYVSKAFDYSGTTVSGNSFTSLVTNSYTAQCWMNPAADIANAAIKQVLVYGQDTSGGNCIFLFDWDHTSAGAAKSWIFYDGSGYRIAKYTSTMNKNNWYRISATKTTSTALRAYFNGTYEVGTAATANPNLTYSYFSVGAKPGGGSNFSGIVDEIRVSDKVREDAWLKFDYWNMMSTNNYELTYSAQENNGPLSTGNFFMFFV